MPLFLTEYKREPGQLILEDLEMPNISELRFGWVVWTEKIETRFKDETITFAKGVRMGCTTRSTSRVQPNGSTCPAAAGQIVFSITKKWSPLVKFALEVIFQIHSDN